MMERALEQGCFFGGYDLANYQKMFDLNAEDLTRKTIDCCSGPNTFTAQYHAQGGDVVSCDPCYALPPAVLQKQFDDLLALNEAEIKSHPDHFVWQQTTAQKWIASRREHFQAFLQDYGQAKESNRYSPCELSALSYPDQTFDLALCAHFFFSRYGKAGLAAHLCGIRELCRVAVEVRIFPLLDPHGAPSPMVGPLLLELQNMDECIAVCEVPYQVQAGGNAMLRVWLDHCDIAKP